MEYEEYSVFRYAELISFSVFRSACDMYDSLVEVMDAR